MTAPKQNLPHNRTAEEAVLGGLFIDPDQIEAVFDVLAAPDFYIKRHEWIYAAMVECFVNGVRLDLVTVGDALECLPSEDPQNKKNRLDDIGGPAFLTELTIQAPFGSNILDHADIVMKMSVRRQIIKKATASARAAQSLDKPFEDVIGDVDAIWEDRPAPSTQTWQKATTAAAELKTKIDANTPLGVSTGLPNADAVYGGYPIEGLTLYTGDSSSGKTALLLQSAEIADFNGKRALYFTFEHSPWRMVARRVFTQTGIPMTRFRNNSLTAADRIALKNRADAYIAKHPNLVFDQYARSIPQMRRTIRQVRPDLVIVDDLTHVDMGFRAGSNDAKLLIEACVQLKTLSTIPGCPCAVVAIHHMSADEASKAWPTQSKQGGKPQPAPTVDKVPALDSITWARDIRYIVDMWLAHVPAFDADIMADEVKMVQWVMKDRDGVRLTNPVILYYDKVRQWFYDQSNRPNRGGAQVPTQGRMP
jgi:replicative DNA helicase